MHVHQGHLEYEVQVHPVVLDLVVHPVQLGPVVLDCVARDLQAPEVQLDPLVLCHPKELPLLELHLEDNPEALSQDRRLLPKVSFMNTLLFWSRAYSVIFCCTLNVFSLVFCQRSLHCYVGGRTLNHVPEFL